jgi:hypothetical protein
VNLIKSCNAMGTGNGSSLTERNKIVLSLAKPAIQEYQAELVADKELQMGFSEIKAQNPLIKFHMVEKQQAKLDNPGDTRKN